MRTDYRKQLLEALAGVEGENAAQFREFIAKHKPWDESKVPSVSIITTYGCKECDVEYDIYKNMVLL